MGLKVAYGNFAHRPVVHFTCPAFEAMSMTGTVKKFMEDKGFGFISPDDGSEDVFIHIKQCNGAETLCEGDKVTYDNEWNDRKGKMQGNNCTVTGGGEGGSG